MPNHLFRNVVAPNNAMAIIGVKLGGCGISLITTANKTNAKINFSLLVMFRKMPCKSF